MDLTGPGRGHALLRTELDPSATQSLGTWNNCGSGRTPWGTFLTCEENFNGYFASTNWLHQPTPAQKRYGIGRRGWGYGWERHDERFEYFSSS